jgi:hypothetical protein
MATFLGLQNSKNISLASDMMNNTLHCNSLWLTRAYHLSGTLAHLTALLLKTASAFLLPLPSHVRRGFLPRIVLVTHDKLREDKEGMFL